MKLLLKRSDRATLPRQVGQRDSAGLLDGARPARRDGLHHGVTGAASATPDRRHQPQHR
ncbi:MAG: hypothetical protein R3F43_00765 [bacterium]